MSHSEEHHGHFVVPTKYYVGTFIALLILTIITVAVSRVDLGFLNIPVALGVALIKMSFVVFIFMGLKWDKPVNAIFFFSSFFCIALFLYFTFADIALRGDVFPEEAGIHNINSPVKPLSDGSHGTGAHTNSVKH